MGAACNFASSRTTLRYKQRKNFHRILNLTLFHTEPKQTTAIGDVTFNATFGWHAYTLYGRRVWDLTMKLAGSYVTGMGEQQYLRQAMGREVPNNLKKRMPRVDLR